MTDDGLMVRVDPAHTAHLLEQPGVAEVVMGARAPMTGWVQARGEALVDDAALASWVRRGLERAQALPPER